MFRRGGIPLRFPARIGCAYTLLFVYRQNPTGYGEWPSGGFRPFLLVLAILGAIFRGTPEIKILGDARDESAAIIVRKHDMKKYVFVQILTLVVGVGFFFWDHSPYWDCLDNLSICQTTAWCKHHRYHRADTISCRQYERYGRDR